MKQVGKVTHYYGKLGVAIIKLSSALKVGDHIQFGDGDNSFKQTVESMQVERESVSQAKKGASVGVKVHKIAKDGTVVYEAEE